MTQLQAANHGNGVAPYDLYCTPADVTAAVIPLLHEYRFPTELWEPACGKGDMARVLEGAGFDVLSSDLADHGFGTSRKDFLQTTFVPINAVVTNPPWSLAREFVRHAVITLDIPYVAMLLKDTFWQAADRDVLWQARRPCCIAQLTWRPDFTGSRAPYFGCCWSIWTPDDVSACEFVRVSRPPTTEVAVLKQVDCTDV